MEPLPVFVAQFVWFLAAWSAIARLVLWPLSLRLTTEARLSLWIAPQMFRILGVGLLVPNLAPGIPREFAIATAAGDSATALLALLAFVSLRRRWPWAWALAWACTLVGVTDLVVAFAHAAGTGAVAHLAAQWYVPVLAGPIMVVSHAACLTILLHARRRPDALHG